MEIKVKQQALLQARERASKRLDEWKKRNSRYMKNWDIINILRSWREKRWSSSMRQ